jgi:hypothetical protein
MKRPEFWDYLPGTIQESIVNSSELEYDSYEGSFAEAKESILNNPNKYYPNYKIVQDYYLSISDDELKRIVKVNINALENDVETLKQFLDN